MTQKVSTEDHQALVAAARALEHEHLAARIAALAGQPLSRLVAGLPDGVSDSLHRLVEKAMIRSLDAAITSLPRRSEGEARLLEGQILSGLSGAVGGAFGIAALPVELPLTTTLMLRTIADIAHAEGEDLTSMEARLACLQVFALSSRQDDVRTDLGYFAARAALARMSAEAATLLVEKGAAGAASPVVRALASAIASRFSAVVADKVAASAVPVVGALGGAAVNLLFVRHFQTIARGHFTVRRLERAYGPDIVRDAYALAAAERRVSQA